MPIIDITQYHAGGKRRMFYAESVKQYDQIRTHALGEYPKELISERRPGESVTIQKYREKIYIPKTQSTLAKVFNSLQKIRKSTDYLITFKSDKIPAVISKDETPQIYLTENFPKYGSLDNWFWSVCFNQYLMDANGMVMIVPVNTEKEDNEYYKPYPIIFNSNECLDYTYGESAVFKSKEVSKYKSGNRTYDGAVYYSCDKISIVKYEQINAKGDFNATEFVHNLGKLPIVSLYGVIQRDGLTDTLYSSRIAPMIPSLNEAAREWSDLQAEVVQHIHSTMWAIHGKECTTCKGTGVIPSADGAINCNECNGRGFYPFNPYEHITIKPPQAGENNPPTPPAGYLTKPIEIATLQDKRVHDHLYHSLASLNMEFLASVPLSQSGTAKEVDRAELNNFVYSIAEDCVRIIDSIAGITIDYRYGGIVVNENDRKALHPMINVPEKYDMIPDSYLVEEISKLRAANVSPVIVNTAEIEYASKKFNTNKDVQQRLTDIYTLDPLSGMSVDEIMVAYSNNVIDKRSYVIHSNIRAFVDKLRQDAGYASMDVPAKVEAVNKLAEEWMRSNRPATISGINIQTDVTDEDQ